MSQHKVLTAPAVIKQGSGQRGPWTLYGITVEGHEGQVSGFDAVQVGEMVEIEAKQNGQYTNWNYKKIKDTPTQAAAPQPAAGVAGASPLDSQRIEKTLRIVILMAEESGVDPAKIADILGV